LQNLGSNPTCQKKRKSIANKNWHQKNLDYDRSRRHKTRVWANADFRAKTKSGVELSRKVCLVEGVFFCY